MFKRVVLKDFSLVMTASSMMNLREGLSCPKAALLAMDWTIRTSEVTPPEDNFDFDLGLAFLASFGVVVVVLRAMGVCQRGRG